jgi:photosystem II stability/assembly factor-like uncharacterized protein
MRKLNLFLALLSLLFANNLYAQVKILNDKMNPTGVSNEGLVVGYYEWASPYSTWDPATNELTEIGGVSPGNGVGGQGHYSADSKYMCASMWNTFALQTEWNKNTLKDYAYKFNALDSVPLTGKTCFAIGESGDGTGLIFSSNEGKIWKKRWTSKHNLNDITFLTSRIGLICGDDAYMAYTKYSGSYWQDLKPIPAECTDTVVSYKTMDFIKQDPYYGVVGVELKGGKFTAYQTANGAESWNKTTGVTGIPLCITHTSKAFYMGTKNGHILKSTDNGVTWTKLFATGGFLQPTIPIYKIKFADDKIGIALTDIFIYRTTDGGDSWTALNVDDNMSQKVKLYDALWQNDSTAILVGSLGVSYKTTDKGQTWKKENIESDNTSDLNCIMATKTAIIVGGVNGNIYSKNLIDSVRATGMAIYDTEKGQWNPLGGLGYYSDDVNTTTSSPYAVSGDGNNVVGLAWYADPTQTSYGKHSHAVVWNRDNGIIDLGSHWESEGRNARANAVSYDGSVVAGWQDHNVWYASVWYRNEDGKSYQPGEFILKDAKGKTDDELNFAYEARAVSKDGKYIGGIGESIFTGPLAPKHDTPAYTDEATNTANQPWIWSKEDGIKRLGIIDEFKDNNQAIGYLTAMNNDATVAVGFFTCGNATLGFLWTKDGGMRSINDYLDKVYNIDTSESQYGSVVDMSPNGRYITGWGNDNYTGVFVYEIDLLYDVVNGINTSSIVQPIATVYPNPVADELHVDVPMSGTVNINMFDTQGKKVMNKSSMTTENTINVSNLPAGLYILSVDAKNLHKSYKVVVKH